MILSLSLIDNQSKELNLISPIKELPELQKLGCEGPVTAKISVHVVSSVIWLDVKVQGTISLDCGRCLEKLTGAFRVALKVSLEKKTTVGLEWIEGDGQSVDEYGAKMGPDVTEVPLEHLIVEQILLNYNPYPLPTIGEDSKCIQCSRVFLPPAASASDKKMDPRWEKLMSLKKHADNDKSNGNNKKTDK